MPSPLRLMRPTPGIIFACSVATDTYRDGVTDGDTIRVHRKGSTIQFPVRLLDCWAPETTIRGVAKTYPVEVQERIKLAGAKAREVLVELLDRSGDDMLIHIPFPPGAELMDLFTLGRVLGHVWARDIHVASYLCERKVAYPTKEALRLAGLM